MKRRSARIRQARARKIIQAVLSEDVEGVSKCEWRCYYRATEADESVSDAYATHRTPGMLAALRNLGFTILLRTPDGMRASPSHVCTGLPIPDHVIKEDYPCFDYGTCRLTSLQCALRLHDYDTALRICKQTSLMLPPRAALDACVAGKCDEFQARLMRPVLAWRVPPIEHREAVLCHHGVASYDRACALARLKHPAPFDCAIIVQDFLGLWDRGRPLAPAAEQAAVLIRAHEEGLNIDSPFNSYKLQHCLRPETRTICRQRFRAPIVDAVAAHLPVEGVPEIVASYVRCPLDVLFY